VALHNFEENIIPKSAMECFHSMERLKPQNIDGTVLINRHNQQKRRSGLILRANAGKT
jgi:cytochrome c-type biogenesis protein CcmH/NrfG